MRISDWISDVCSSDLPLQRMKPVISSLEADRWASLFHRLPADLPAEKPLAMPLQAFGECPGRFTVPPTAPLNITDRRLLLFTTEIGRASCRERVCQYV